MPSATSVPSSRLHGINLVMAMPDSVLGVPDEDKKYLRLKGTAEYGA
jgi:hypothetical protein